MVGSRPICAEEKPEQNDLNTYPLNAPPQTLQPSRNDALQNLQCRTLNQNLEQNRTEPEQYQTPPQTGATDPPTQTDMTEQNTGPDSDSLPCGNPGQIASQHGMSTRPPRTVTIAEHIEIMSEDKETEIYDKHQTSMINIKKAPKAKERKRTSSTAGKPTDTPRQTDLPQPLRPLQSARQIQKQHNQETLQKNAQSDPNIARNSQSNICRIFLTYIIPFYELNILHT